MILEWKEEQQYTLEYKLADDLINNGRLDVDKIMILLTDGQNDAGPEIVIQEATNAKNQGIIIFTIGLTGFVDSDMLTSVASETVNYYYAPDASALQTIFNQIREVIKEYTTSKMLSEKFKIVFINATTSYTEEITDSEIKPFETKKFEFDLTGKITNVIRIEIYPVIINQGKEVIGALLESYTFEK
jgi:hypothetical protein